MFVQDHAPRRWRFGMMKPVLMFTALALTPLAALGLLVAVGAG